MLTDFFDKQAAIYDTDEEKSENEVEIEVESELQEAHMPNMQRGFFQAPWDSSRSKSHISFGHRCNPQLY